MRKLKDERSFLLYLVLGFITFGIYQFFFLWGLIKDVNVACRDDNDKTPGLIPFILLTFVTCGIYGIVWYYRMVARLNRYCDRSNIRPSVTPMEWLGWFVFGALICGIGSYVAQYKLIELSNNVMNDYNASLYRRERENM